MKLLYRPLLLLMVTPTLSFAQPVLERLHIQPSEQSLDFVEHKKQFQLHTLLTEQRHPKTRELSYKIKSNTAAGIEELLSVDQDVSNKFLEIAEDTQLLEQAANAIVQALRENRKIYIYGCGATGRLAKQMESSFWRPFWKKVASLPQAKNIYADFPQIEDALIGEMTGADRALISSLEGFEDLPLIGKLQLEDHQIQKGDVVFAITEGGETSSVIGTILAALNQYGEATLENKAEHQKLCQKHLYFIYNNPDSLLLPIDRSRQVIENNAITKIRLCTGPQAITGSTRLQATTSETFIMGLILEQAIHQLLQPYFAAEDLKALGFEQIAMKERVLSFLPLQKAVFSCKDQIAKLTDLESSAYAAKHFATYFAQDALITVFTDGTERAPTFRLFPLDTTLDAQRKSWIQIWTPASDCRTAWHNFLGRSFCGLQPAGYETPFSEEIKDPYLRNSALASLKKAGNEQQFIYDFSFSALNIERRGPQEGDIGVLALLGEEIEQLKQPEAPFQQWLKLFSEKGAHVALIVVGNTAPPDLSRVAPGVYTIQLPLQTTQDPLKLRQHVALKMLLNAHSTGVMAKLGRVVGNTMTNVNPGNLKLIGRATFLILTHVNEKVEESQRISYAEANAVLFDAIEYAKKNQKVGESAEVGLSIIRLVECLKKDKVISWEEAEKLLQEKGLDMYLQEITL